MAVELSSIIVRTRKLMDDCPLHAEENPRGWLTNAGRLCQTSASGQKVGCDGRAEQVCDTSDSCRTCCAATQLLVVPEEVVVQA